MTLATCSDVEPAEKHLMLRQDIQVNQLRLQKQALEESLISLRQSTNTHNNKLKVLRQDYQQKLQSLTQQVQLTDIVSGILLLFLCGNKEALLG
jgi:deoxyribodipyrimidine photolyase